MSEDTGEPGGSPISIRLVIARAGSVQVARRALVGLSSITAGIPYNSARFGLCSLRTSDPVMPNRRRLGALRRDRRFRTHHPAATAITGTALRL